MKINCYGCNRKFEGRRDAKTCSVKCRKRLQRMLESAKTLENKVGAEIKQVEKTLEISAQNLVDNQGGFALATDPPQEPDLQPPVAAPPTAPLPEPSTPPVSDSLSVPVLPVAQPPKAESSPVLPPVNPPQEIPVAVRTNPVSSGFQTERQAEPLAPTSPPSPPTTPVITRAVPVNFQSQASNRPTGASSLSNVETLEGPGVPTGVSEAEEWIDAPEPPAYRSYSKLLLVVAILGFLIGGLGIWSLIRSGHQLPKGSPASKSPITLSVKNNTLNINGNLQIQQAAVIGGHLTAKQGADIIGDLNVDGNGHFTGDITANNITANNVVAASSFQANGQAGTSLSCNGGDLLSDASVQGGIMVSGNCVASPAVPTVDLQTAYNNSNPTEIVLNSSNGALTLRDSASPLGGNLFEVQDNSGGTTFFAVNATGVILNGNLNANTLQQTAPGNNVNILAGNDSVIFTANGRTYQFPTGGPANQTICTSGVTCTTPGGEAVLLAPATAQTDNSANVSIFINDTGGGNLLQLQAGGVDKFVVDNNGNVTATGFSGSGANLTGINATNITTGTLNDARLSTNVALLNGNNNFTGTLQHNGNDVCDVSGNCTTSGAAGGDLTGSYPNPTIAKLQGVPFSITSLTSGQILQYNGTNWVNQTISGDITLNSSGVATIGNGVVTNAKLANSSLTITAGNGLSGGGSVSLGGSTTLSVTYGSAANTSVQGNTTLVCPSGTGNLTGGGNTITLGAGGTCNNLTVVNSPTFSGDLAVQGSGGITIGVAGSTTGNLNLANATNSQLSILQTAAPTGTGNVTYQLPSGVGGNTYTLCTDAGNCAGTGGGITGSGTTNTIAKFTGSQTIGNSLLTDDGSVVTVAGDLTVNSSNTLFANTFQQTGSGNNVNLSAGNDDIVFTAGGRTFQFPTSGPASQTICTTGVTCASGGGQAVILAPGSAQTDNTADDSIFINDTGGGNLLHLQSSGIDRFIVDNSGNLTTGTINGQTISSAANFTGSITAAGDIAVNGGDITSTGALNITPGGTLTLGATGQIFTLQGTGSSTITANGGGGTTTLGFSGTPTGAVIYNLDRSATPGTYTICTSSGNCVGSGGGAPNNAAYLTVGNDGTLSAERAIAVNSTNLTFTDGGANGSYTINTIQNIAISSSPTFSGLTLSSLGAGLVQSSAGGVLSSGAVDRNSSTFFNTTLSVANGGTGATTFTTNGVVYGNGTSALQATAAGTSGQVLLANGSGVPTFTTLSGDVAVNSSGVTTIQPDSVALGTDTTGPYVANLGALTGLTTTGNSGEGSTPTLSVTYGSTANTSVQGNTTLVCPSGTGNLTGGGNTITLGSGGSCNNLTVVNSPTFSGDLTVQGSTGITIGIAGTTAGNLNLANATNSQLSILQTQAPTGTGDVTYQLPSGVGGNTYTLCTDAGNCVGSGGGAPNGAAYLTVGNDATLSAERAIAVNATNLSFSDGGANGSYTINTIQNIATSSSPTFSGLTLSSLGAGLVQSSSGGVLSSGAVDRNSSTFFTGTLSVANGGTGTTSFTTNGLLYGNGTSALQATAPGTSGQVLLANGSGVPTFTTLSGDVTVNSTGVTTIQPDAVALGTDTTGNYVATLTAGNGIGITGAGSEGANPTVALGPLTADWNQSGAFDVVLNNSASELKILESGTSPTFYGILDSGDLTADRTITIPDASGTICLDTNNCGFATSGSGVTSLDSLTGALTINNTSGSGSAITIDNASTTQKGIAQFNSTNFTASAGTINTIQDIATTSSPTFSGLTLSSLGAGLVQSSAGGILSSGAVDRNSSTFFTGTLSVANGGTNTTTIGSAGSVAYSNGSAYAFTGVGSSNQILTSGGSGTPTFQNIASLLTAGTNINISGTTNATIATVNNPTFSTSVTTPLLQSTGALSITPGGALTIGATSQSFTLQGTGSSVITANGGGGTTTIGFSGTPVGNVTYNFDRAATPGTYTVCSTAGNCAGTGGGVTTPGGTTNQLAKFTGSQTIGDSQISDDGTTVTIANQLVIQGTNALTLGTAGPGGNDGAIVLNNATNSNTLTLLSGATASNLTLTLPTADGSNGYCLETDGAGVLSFNSCTGGAGGGVTSLNGQTGVVTLANASGSGGTVTIDNASTTQKGIAQFSATNFTASAGVINTIQDIATTSSPTFSGLTLSSLGAGLVQSSAGGVLSSGAVDRNSSTFFNTTLSVANGGTGATTFTTNGVVYGNGTSALQATAAGTSGQVLLANGSGVPTFTTLSGDVAVNSSGVTTIQPDAVALGTDTTGNYVATITAGNGISGSSATEGGTPTIALGNLTADWLQSGAFDIVLNNSSSELKILESGTSPTFYGILDSGDLTADRTITIPDASGVICLDTNNCGFATTGSGVTSLDGLTGALTINNTSGSGTAITIDNASTSTKGIAQFNATNFTAASGVINTIQDIAISSSPTFSALTLTSANALTLGTASTNTGKINFFGSGSANSIALVGPTSPGASLTLTLPNETGTLCSTGSVCTGYQASGSYVNLQGSTPGTQQTGHINVSGTIIAGTSLQAPLLDTSSATALNIGTTNATVINLNKDTVLAAGKSLTVTGGNTASRPGSPTEGMVYYDTTTKQLLVYANGKWQADRTTATKIVGMGSPAGCTGSTPVASSNFDAADFVVNSCTSAQTTINSAISALPAGGGTVYLMEGTYIVDGSIDIPNNVKLVGAGNSTILKFKNSASSTLNLIENSDQTNGNSNIAVQNLKLDGNKANNGAGFNQIGMNWFQMGSGSGSSAVPGVKVDNVTVTNFKSYGIKLYVSFNSSITNSALTNNDTGLYAQDFTTGRNLNNIVANNNAQGNASDGFSFFSGGGYSVTGNTAQGNSYGFDVNFTYGSTFSGNLASNNTQYGFWLSTASHNDVVGNTARSNSVGGIGLSSTNNSNISGNKLYDNGGSGANSSIQLDTSDSNSIISNDISDTAGTGYAINISDSASDTNYLADNRYSGTGATSINDAGTGTKYANQLDSSNNLINSTSGSLVSKLQVGSSSDLFQAQDSSGNALLKIGSTGILTLGRASNNTGTIVFQNATNANTITLQSGVATANRTITLPDETGTVCLQTSANCGFAVAGSGVTSLDGLTGALTINNTSGSGSAITIDNASTTQKGIAQFNSTNFTASAGTINTIQDIATTSSPTFSNLTLTGSTGLSVGTASNMGQIVFKDGTADGFTNTLNTVTLTASRTISLPNESGTLCIQSSANCGFALSSGGGTAFVQGGNSFGAQAVLGTNDNNSLAIRTNGTNRLVLDTSGNLAFQQASTLSTSTGALTVQGAGGLTLKVPSISSNSPNSAIAIQGGNNTGLGDGGAVNINGGSSLVGSGGAINITGGSTTSSGVFGGDVTITGGAGDSTNAPGVGPGAVNINGGVDNAGGAGRVNIGATGGIVSVGSNSVAGGSVVLQSSSLKQTISGSSNIILTTTNTTTAFQIQDSNANNILSVNTTTTTPGTPTFNLTSVQPTIASSGANASSVLTVAGAKGGNANGAGNTGGTGAGISLNSGAGGNSIGTNGIGGAGGSISITSGAGGASSGTAANANGGNIVFQGGAAGTGGSGTAGSRGNILLQGSGGNVGIGLSGTPAALLSVGGTTGSFQVNSSGAIAAATGITSSGTISFTGLSTNGLVKTTGGTGTLAVATAGTDYEVPLTFNNGLTRTSNTVTLGGTLNTATTTITAPAADGLVIASDLSTGARSSYPLVISQANNATNDNSVGLLQLSNSDAGSGNGVLSISQISAGTGIIFSGITNGTAINASGIGNGTVVNATGLTGGTSFNSGGPSTTTGTGFLFNTTSTTLTTGSALSATGSASGGLSAYTGSLINVTPTRTLTSGSINDTGNFLNLTRANTVNNAGSTFTVSGALANLQSNCTQTAGTCTDTANILNLNQQYASASGAVLNVSNSGSGAGINLSTTAGGVGINLTGATSGTALQANTLTSGTVVSATGLTSGTGLNVLGLTTGIGVLAGGTGTTTGQGLFYSTTSTALTTGSAVRVTGSASGALSAYTGAIINVTPSRTLTSGSINDSGNLLSLSRTNTVNNAGSTFTVSGALANLTSNCTQTAGTCTDSSNVLSLNQQYASASGAVAVIQNAGTGNALQIQDSSGNVNAAFNNVGNQLTLGRVASSGTVTQGKLLFADGTTDNFSSTLDTNTLTASRNIHLPNASGTICLDSNNCGFATAGSGVTSLDSLTGALTINNTSGSGSAITIDNASTSAKGIAQFNSTNFTASSGTINTIQDIATSSSPTFNGLTLSSLGAGLVQSSAGGVLSSGAVDRNSSTFFSNALSVPNGGTGTTSFTTNGLLYGNGTSALQATAPGTSGQVLLANGSGVPTFTTLSGDVTVNSTGVTTIQPDAVALGTDTTGNYVATLTAGNGIGITGAGSEGANPTVALGPLTADWNQSGAFDVVLNNSASELKILESGTSPTFYGILDTGDLTADRTITIPDESGTICVQNSINCGFALSSGGGTAFVQGGNSFGAPAVLGTNDSNTLAIRTNSTTRLTFDTSDNLYLGRGITTGVPTTFTVQATGGSSIGVTGGRLNIKGGAGTTTGSGSQGGDLNLSGGSANGDGSVNRSGGQVSIQGGAPIASGSYGSVVLQTAGGNVGIGTATFGTSANAVLALGQATEPTTSPADNVQLYVTDAAAGDARLRVRMEGGGVVTFPNETGTICTTGSVCSGYAPASGSANYIQNQSASPQSASFYISGTGRVAGHAAIGNTGGIDNGDPSAYSNVLTVSETVTNLGNPDNNGIYNKLILDPSSAPLIGGGTQYGVNNIVDVASGNTRNISLIYGYSGSLEHLGSGTITNAIGLSSVVANTTGTIGGAVSGQFGVVNASTGTINNGYGVFIQSATNSGTFTNNYGLYVQDQSAVGSTDSYNIYSAGSSSKNYFAGNVGIGDTTPAALLTVGSGDLFQVNGSGQVTYVNGSANTDTVVCKNSSGQLAPCSTATLTGNAFVQGGNSFGTTGTLGTNDNNNLAFETNNVTRWLIDTSGNLLPNLDDTYNIGSDTARVQDLYLGPGSLHVGTSTTDEGTLSYDTTANTLNLAVNGSVILNASTASTTLNGGSGTLLTGNGTTTTLNAGGGTLLTANATTTGLDVAGGSLLNADAVNTTLWANGGHLLTSDGTTTTLSAGGGDLLTANATTTTLSANGGDLLTGNATIATLFGSLNVTSAGNVGIGTSTFGTSAQAVLGLGQAIAPTTSPADLVQLYVTDAAAGDARLRVRMEGGGVVTFPNETGTVCTTGSICSGYQAAGSYESPLTFNNGLTRTVNTVQLGGSLLQNTTIAAGNSFGLTLTSDLSGGARSSYPLIISQANDATNDNANGLLQLTNSDTGSSSALLAIQQVSGGTGIRVSGVTTGTGIDLSTVSSGTAVNATALVDGQSFRSGGTGVTSGTGFLFDTNSTAITSGSILRTVGSATGALSSYTGSLINIAMPRTLTSGSINDSGNFLNLTRSNTVNNTAGASAYTISGALATLQSNCTVADGGVGGADSCTDTSNILALTQNYANASGAVLNIRGAGTGNLITVTDTTATARDVLTIADGGATTFRNQTDSTSALAVQKFDGTNIFNVDTTNSKIGTVNTTIGSTNSQALTIKSGDASGATSNSGAVTIDSGSATGTAGNISIGTGAYAHNTTIGNTTGSSAITIQSGTGNLQLTTQGTGTLGIGNNAVAQTIAVGNSTGATAVTIASGTGNLQLTTQGTGTLGVGNNAVAQTIAIGNSTGATAVTIASGTGNLQLTTQGTGTLGIGNNAVAQNIAIGNTTGATGVTIQGGTGTSIAIGTGGIGNTIQIGTTTGAVTQTINIGNNATASSTTNLVLGSTVAGSTTVQSAGGLILSTLGTAANAVAICRNSVSLQIISCGINSAGVNLQQGYDASTGGTTPEIKLDSTRAAIDIQDANTSIAADTFNIRGSNAGGLGTAVFTIGQTNYTDTSGSKTFQTVAPSFAPTSTSTASFIAAAIQPTINFSAGTPGAGNTTALLIKPTYTAAPTGINLLIDAQNASTSVFQIGRTGDALMRTTTNSATAFQVQDTSNNTILGVNTSLGTVLLGKASAVTGKLVVNNSTNSNTVTIQSGITSGTYTLTLPTAVGASGTCLKTSDGSGTLTFGTCGGGGTSRSTLVPEFPGAVLTPDGTNNSGTMTSDFCSGTSHRSINTGVCAATDDHNYYSWTSASGDNDYDIYVRYQLTAAFAKASSTINTFGWRTDNTNNDVAVSVYNASGNQCGATTSVATGTATWTETVLGSVTADTDCDMNANDMVVIKIHLVASASEFARVGEIRIDY